MSLDLSTNGPDLIASYNAVRNTDRFQASSPSHAKWALFSVQAPGNVLNVEDKSEGELEALTQAIDSSSIMFAFVKVVDPNTTVLKNVLISWCGPSVPANSKTQFSTFKAIVQSTMKGYHVEMVFRDESDFTPEEILKTVGNASGSRYTAGTAPPHSTKPPIAPKAFTPTMISAAKSGSTLRRAPQNTGPVDEDGWGKDAPPVTRTQLEKVAPAYQPTKVMLSEFHGQKKDAASRENDHNDHAGERPDVVKGAYQPVGKVDISEIRRQAQAKGHKDERPTAVRGAYEPIGKVDIAAIRARAQPPSTSASASTRSVSQPSLQQEQDQQDEQPQPKSLAQRSAAFTTQSERMTTLPKPRPSAKFTPSTFTGGTKAPVPGGFVANPPVKTAPVGSASRTFADQGGKTPAQIWAEKKANQGKLVSPNSTGANPAGTSPIASQNSGGGVGGGWKSSYAGKTWAPVQTSAKTGQSNASSNNNSDYPTPDATHDEDDDDGAPQTNPGFSSTNRLTTIPQPPPLPSMASRPAPVPVASTPEPEEELDEPSSPIRVALPVRRQAADEKPTPTSHIPLPPPIPNMSRPAPVPEPEPELEGKVPGVKLYTAHAIFDYKKAEDNEIDLEDGELITDIDKVDDDWWLGRKSNGDSGLFPSNYVKIDDEDEESAAAPTKATPSKKEEEDDEVKKHTATAQYEYEAAEDNELSFPDGVIITDLEFPDDDWWFGHYNGKQGLFPANYVEKNEH